MVIASISMDLWWSLIVIVIIVSHRQGLSTTHTAHAASQRKAPLLSNPSPSSSVFQPLQLTSSI
jgi:hypothetical protein